MHILDFLFGAAVAVSLRASLVLLAILGLRWGLRRVGAVRLVSWLWLVLLARLLLPALPGSRFSVFNWLRTPAAGVSASPLPWFASSGFRAVTRAPAARPSNPPTGSGWAANEVGPWTISPLAAVWALGVLGVLGGAVASGLSLGRAMRRARPARAPEVRAAQLVIATRLHLPALEVRETELVGSPALAGVFSPVVLVPPGLLARLSPEARVHVLLHELGHWRRRDLWVQALFTVAVAAHWWNPLVWLALRLWRADREVACDEWVLRHLGETGAEAYGKTLLVVSTRPSRLLFPVAMAEDRRGLRDRIERIAAFRGASHPLLAAVVTAFALLALADEGGAHQLPFTSHPDLAPGDALEITALRSDSPVFAPYGFYEVHGRYRFAGCERVVVVAEGLGAPPGPPPRERIRVLPCGGGTFVMAFRAQAPDGLAFSFMNARGAQGVAGLVLAPRDRPPRLPAMSIREVRWRGDWPGPGVADDRLLELENGSNQEAFVYWRDRAGLEKLHAFLAPGERYRIFHWPEHTLVVTGEGGAPLGVSALRAEGSTLLRIR